MNTDVNHQAIAWPTPKASLSQADSKPKEFIHLEALDKPLGLIQTTRFLILGLHTK